MSCFNAHLVRIAIVLLLSGSPFGCQKTTNPKDKTAMSNDHNSSETSEITEEELSRRWRQESEQYVTAINDFVRRGDEVGWENVDEKEPEDTRQPLAEAVLDAVRRANESGRIEGLHERFPRAHGPFIELLEENGQSLPVVFLLDDGRIVMRIGAPYETGRVVIINDDRVESLSPDVITVGRSPNREFFTIAREDGVAIHQGWEGPIITTLQWPSGREGIPPGFDAEPIHGTPIITRLVPFDTGDRALLVSPDGVFILTQERALRLLPTEDQMKEHFEWLQGEYPDKPLFHDLSMEHGTISPDGKLIATGSQSGPHYVFDAESLEIIAEVGHLSEYPHYAAFSSDGSIIAFNSCHFYNGMTVGVPTSLLPGLKTEPYESDDRLIQLEDGSRVYAAVARNDAFIIGDASGYLRAFDLKGNPLWRHFIGSTVGDIDISPDGRHLVVTTYAGFLSILELDTGKADPFVIGNSTHQERRRWLFWKQEKHPLIW